MKPVLLAILMSILLLSGCDEKEKHLKHQNTEQFSEGILLVGCSTSHDEHTKGILTNTTMLSVRIREVAQGHGEKTQTIFVLPSGKTIQIDNVYTNGGIYIYTMDGVMVGWISYHCPKS